MSVNIDLPETLAISHYHWRTGGVRMVIERSLPSLLAHECGQGIRRVLLLSGEDPPDLWLAKLRLSCAPIPVLPFTCPQAGYTSELSATPDLAQLRSFFTHALEGKGKTLIWSHNPSLARNLPAVAMLQECARESGASLLLHHHDFWCDNRWDRWIEAQAHGIRSPEEIADIIFPLDANTLHACITRSDANLLTAGGKCPVAWLPNPFSPGEIPDQQSIAQAKAWLQKKANTEEGTPLWLLPCRFLRRKNVLEALLLSQRLHPGSQLLTSASPSSQKEIPYFQQICETARASHWNLRPIAFEANDAPSFDAVMAAADVLVLPSLQEGFGLASLEASALQRPLVCRKLKNIEPDLASFGFAFPDAYEECWIANQTISLPEEQIRQRKSWARWRKTIPAEYQTFVPPPPSESWNESETIPLSRLTLPGQIQVLEKLLTPSRRNPRQQTPPRFENLRLPERALQNLSAKKYADRFWNFLCESLPATAASITPQTLQARIVKDRLQAENLYPLLWDTPSQITPR